MENVFEFLYFLPLKFHLISHVLFIYISSKNYLINLLLKIIYDFYDFVRSGAVTPVSTTLQMKVKNKNYK